jgi:hypothetical protein
MELSTILALLLAFGPEDESPNEVTILLRESTPYGKMFRGSVPLPTKIEWGDAYPRGFGIGVEFDGSFEYGPGRAGFYGSIMTDLYRFDTGFDALGSDVELDPLVMVTISGGPKYDLHFGKGFYWSNRLGVGVVVYPPVDVRGPGGSDRFIDLSYGFEAEAGTRLGWGNRHVSLEIGVSYRIQGGPRREDTGFGNFQALSIEAGVGFRF